MGLSVSDQTDQLLGTLLQDRFELLSCLGAGGMGVVFKALDHRQSESGEADPYIAVKVLRDEYQQDHRFLTVLARETKKSQQLAHPHIINVFDFDRWQNISFMTMELLQGQNLKQFLKNTPDITQKDRQQLALQLVDAVLYAHQNHVVHADLKPANIFVHRHPQTQAYHATIFDFGISRTLHQTTDTFSGCSPAYATPATVNGKLAGSYDDAYGLGCVIYMLLTGVHPYQEQASASVINAAAILQPPKNMSYQQWASLKQLLLFAFKTDNVRIKSGEQSSMINELDLDHQEVHDWLAQLQKSFRYPPVSGKWLWLKRIIATLGVLISAYFLIVFSIEQWQSYKVSQALIKQDYKRVLHLLKGVTQTQLHSRLNQKQKQVLLDGLQDHTKQLMQWPSPGYDPVQALSLLKRARAVLPHTFAMETLFQNLQRSRQSQEQILSEGFQDAVSKGRLCNKSPALLMLNTQLQKTQSSNCAKTMNEYGVYLQKLNPELFDSFKPVLLNTLARLSSLALYRGDGPMLSNIYKYAALHFDHELIKKYGIVLSPAPSESILDNSLKSQSTSAAPFNVDQILHSAESKTQAYFDYFQSFITTRQGSLPATLSTPKKIDPCWLKGSATLLCQDQFSQGQGPALSSLVVDIGTSSYRLAVARYELAWRDLADFCQQKKCQVLPDDRWLEPVFNMPAAQINSYLQWLSSNTGHEYRLMRINEWHAIANPYGFLNDLVTDGQETQTPTCEQLGYQLQGFALARISTLQGTVDRHGLHNLADLSPEIVIDGVHNILVPGRFEKRRRCRIGTSPDDYPYGAYRIVRVVE